MDANSVLLFLFGMSLGWLIITVIRELVRDNIHELNWALPTVVTPFLLTFIFSIACLITPTRQIDHAYEPLDVNIGKYAVTVTYQTEDKVTRVQTFIDIMSLRQAEDGKIVKFYVREHRSPFNVHMHDSYMIVSVPKDSIQK